MATAFRKNKKIYLISVTEQPDTDGFPVVTETSSDVWAAIGGVSSQEYANAGLLKIRPEFRAIIWAAEYDDQTIVERDGKRYGVYRTWPRSDDEIELYCHEVMGVND